MRTSTHEVLRCGRALLNSKLLWSFFVAVAIILAYVPSASAGMNTNSRLKNGNANTYCHDSNGPNYWAKGMVWLSNNESDYYSEIVSVGTNTNSARVSIRGAVNTCRTVFDATTNMEAVDVSTSYLSGLEGNRFYRGAVPGNATYAWSSPGSKLYGNLNVSSVALCGPGSLATGSASETIVVSIWRRQHQYRPGYDWTSGTLGREDVPVTVQRTCPTYSYSLVPSISSVTDGSAIEVPTTSLSVIGAVRNNGPTDSRANAPWQLTKLRYGKNSPIPQKAGGISASGSGPCTFYAGEQACDVVASGTRTYMRNNTINHPGTTNIDDYAVGTRICFAMSVRQYTHATENWRHSALSCYVVGKKPKVNILGGDLFVGRAIAGAPNPISTRVVTSISGNSSGTYGSWGEYAIVSSGPVTGMASGSGYVDGSTAYSNLLTFVNSGNTSASCATANGCYGHVSALPSIAERFRITSATPTVGSGSLSGVSTGVYRGSGALSISGSTLPSGRWIVINAPTADVTITGDIRYANGPFTSASQVPQLVIIANSITIAEAVEQVDAWLIAPGRVSGGAVVGGVIRTCNRAPSTISEGNCNRILTVNGPVIANRLILLRTGGSEPNEKRGDPAEIFNFRPDAYMWALQQAQSGGRVTTVSTKELPPRY